MTAVARAGVAIATWVVVGAAWLFGAALAAGCGGGAEADPCGTVDCSRHGSCVAVGGTAACECDPGYFALGVVCQPDPCAARTCTHGSCRQAYGLCECDAGWGGDSCATCATDYHLEGGDCVPDRPCQTHHCVHGQCRLDGEAEVCDCNPGYVGDVCDTCAPGYHAEGLTCVADPADACHPNPCTAAYRTTCVLEGTSYRCDCDEGFHLEGITCVGDDACHPNPCTAQSRATCVVVGGGYECDCDAGYHLEGSACVVDDACHPNPCTETHKTACTITSGGHTCSCDAGHHLEGSACVADDPCHPNPCTESHKTACTVAGLGHTCGCDSGYHLEGSACVLDDACHPDPCTATNKTVCTITGGGHTCSCDAGFHLEGSACVGDDACHPNPCTDFGRTTCQVSGGGYTCACSTGWHEVAGACVPLCGADADLCTAAHTSALELTSSNGHGAVGYNLASHKADALLEHLYRNWDDGVYTRDVLYDSYLGIRTGGTNAWLNTLTPVREEYLEQTGIIHVVHVVGSIQIDTYLYAPYELGRPALVLLGRVTNTGATSASASLYTIHNYHLGYTSPSDPVNPDATTERIQYQSGTGAFLETGVGGVLVHRPLGTALHHACTPNNPWSALNAGQDLVDTADSGTGSDRVAGFQKDFTLAAGASGWFGVVSAFEPNAASQAQLLADVEAVYATKTADAALTEARTSWSAWRTAAPAGLSPQEAWVWRQSEAILRQGQVREPTDLSYGQIVASLPPGQWNIAWTRDMSYAIVALARTGHLTEAKAALEFVLKAESNRFQSYVGAPYQVSVCRYYGKGKEESDVNADGPNIEFDGFGLYLWALSEYLGAGGDVALLTSYWTTIRDKVGNVLAGLTDSTTGLVKADSSIWEVHWNAKQKRYTYTSLAAADGLCRAAALARSRGETTVADAWQAAGVAIRDALRTKSVDGSKVLASSYEELQAASGYHDVASVEALNWMLFDAHGAVATATVASFDSALKVASGRGYFRDDDGTWYDSQEWVWADLRIASGKRLAGGTAAADKLVGWIGAQALANYGMVAELYHPTTSDYEGEVPMVGYGAGAYMVSLLDREAPPTVAPVCGSWEAP